MKEIVYMAEGTWGNSSGERIPSEGSQFEDGAVNVMTEQRDESTFRRVQLKYLAVDSAIAQEI
jgi:hypothetical protein